MIGWQGSDQSWPIVEVGLQYVANKSRSKYVKCFVNKIFHEAKKEWWHEGSNLGLLQTT